MVVNWTRGADHFHTIEYYIIEAKVADEPWSVVVPRLNESTSIVIGRLISALTWSSVCNHRLLCEMITRKQVTFPQKTKFK